MKNLFDPMTGMPGIRCAMPADEDQIFALLVMLHAEISMFGLNPVKLRDGIQLATQRRGGIIFVIDDGKRIAATLGMVLNCEWYSDDEYLVEKWNFVHPDYRRGTDYARRLLEQSKWASDWFTAAARKDGRPPMPFQCGLNTLKRTEGKVRLYARHMICIGAYFMYGLPPRQPDMAIEQMRLVNAMNEKARRERSLEVVPTVETIIRVSQGDNYVQ